MRSILRRSVPLALLAVLWVADVSPERARADPPVPVLLELFTSEGCSSCPPADALLARLVRDQPEPGVRVLTLSEHVDYWNRLGWRDPFSDAVFTSRQRGYSLRVSRGRVYTPQAVIDGHLDALGSDEAAIRAALRRAASTPRGTLSISRAGDVLVIEASALPEGAQGHLFLAWVQDHATSRVTSGENEGRELAHVSVVRALVDRGPIRNATPVRVALTDAPASAVRLVAFVQPEDGAVEAVGELAPLSR